MSEPTPSPAVLSLKSMFPTLDVGLIANVLAQHDGNEDRAVESLLSITDDSFVPPERLGEDTLRAQAELDASYAKALALEEESAALAAQNAHRKRQQERSQSQSQSSRAAPPPSPGTPIDPSNLPYAPRVRKTQPSPYIHNPTIPNRNNSYDYHYGNDAARAEEQVQPGLEERFQKLALQGHKFAVQGQTTFNSFLNSGFVSGLKDKVASVASNIQQPPARQNSGSPVSPQYGNQQHASSSSSSNPTYTSSTNAPRTSNPDFPASAWQLPDDDDASSSAANSINVYQPSISSSSASSFSSVTPSQPIKASPAPPNSTGGKRSDELFRSGGKGSPSLLGTSPSSAALSTSPSQAGKIDFAKLGLLPKQKISLDGKPSSFSLPSSSSSSIPTTTSSPNPSSSSTPAPAPASGPSEALQKLEAQKKADVGRKEGSEDDDEGLEYTRNPFDE